MKELYERGIKNGVEGLRILSRQEALSMEPNLSDDTKGALFAPTGGIICPFRLTSAMAECACMNGVEFSLLTEVRNVSKTENGFDTDVMIYDEYDGSKDAEDTLHSKIVINAAGVYADRFHNMMTDDRLTITPRKGEYCLLDVTAGKHVGRTIFRMPSALGKGILVTPTIHGNLLVGPTADDIDDKEGSFTTAKGLAAVNSPGATAVKNIPMNEVITSFAGLRPHGDRGDFVIGQIDGCPGFIDAAAIESPGLSASPAIGVMVADIVKDILSPKQKGNFIDEIKPLTYMRLLPEEERKKLIKKDSAYGNIICRCATVSEGEILETIRRPLGARTLDAVKRRTGANMGRCQGGFCYPRVMELLSRELGIPIEQITKKGRRSPILDTDIKGGVYTDEAEKSADHAPAPDHSNVYDAVIVGGGPAGMAAALSLAENGIKDILILERDSKLGGILNQCIHNGFGLHTFDEELTGPEYALRYIGMVNDDRYPVRYQLCTMVMNIKPVREGGRLIKEVTAYSSIYGDQTIKAKAVILAMGCREKPRGALNIPGFRPAGIYSAGTAQKFVNMDGLMPGKEVVILGSGDIGLIMARRMSLEGAKVKMVVEIMPYSGGLKRNIVQCLDDFDIPLLLGHTVTQIKGKDRVEAVVISKVDENLKPVPGTEQEVKCDTLLLSVGLIPENELTRNMGIKMSPKTRGAVVGDELETSCPGVFACGNVLHVHDLVDNVSKEAVEAGRFAAQYIKGFENGTGGEAGDPDPESEIMQKFAKKNATRNGVNTYEVTDSADGGKTYTIPCITCPAGCIISVTVKDGKVTSVTGNNCERGEAYAKNEVTAPVRTVTSIVKVSGGCSPVISVKTAEPIPKTGIGECMRIIKEAKVSAPVNAGDVIIHDVFGTDIIATSGTKSVGDR